METMRDRFIDVVTKLLDRHDHVALVLADISSGHFIESGAAAAHPDRVINVGIREQLQIGVAAGMALEGLRPIVHSYAPFLIERPLEQIKLDLIHQGAGAILVSIGASYDAAGEGRTHQAPEDVALLCTFPEMQIHVPGHCDEVEALLESAALVSDPIYIRLTEQSNEQPLGVGALTTVKRGSEGSPVVLCIGPTVDRVVEAAADIDVTITYTATVRPFDEVGLRSALGSSSALIVVEPYLEWTTHREIMPALNDRAIRLMAIGVQRAEHRRYGHRDEHDVAYQLDVRGIRSRIEAFVDT